MNSYTALDKPVIWAIYRNNKFKGFTRAKHQTWYFAHTSILFSPAILKPIEYWSAWGRLIKC